MPPGAYTFEVKARNAFHEESAISSYAFEIAKPWYRTTWAYVGYALLAIFLVYGTFQLNTQRLHLQNEHLERLVYERTTEIWEQHKEIVKKTVKLKRQKTELESAHQTMEEKNEALEQAMERLKNTQSQLVDSEKMASLGQLTAGIAHEINNPINYVKGNINPLRRDFEEIRDLFRKIKDLENAGDLPQAVAQIKAYAEEIDAVYLFEEMDQLLQGISDGAQRTKAIVDGLRTFSRSDLDHFKFVDIHAGLDATLALLNNKLKDRIRIERNYAEMPFVECMPGKLNQVFMNVLDNAIQAIELAACNRLTAGLHAENDAGFIGEISIETQLLSACLPAKGECVQVCISDTGIGIDPAIQPRIFEPFFSTKDVGEGIGLGLSISFGIIERHQGKIEVRSTPGEGATFCITLPFRQSEESEDESITTDTGEKVASEKAES
ncbi:MAG: ATP-binding protein [Bacteroidota bacterium]